MPDHYRYFFKYKGLITLDNDRISIIDDNTKCEKNYPSVWCSITWDNKETVQEQRKKECISIGCHRNADNDGYCTGHSLYR